MLKLVKKSYRWMPVISAFLFLLVAAPAEGEGNLLGVIDFPTSGAPEAQPAFIEGIPLDLVTAGILVCINQGSYFLPQQVMNGQCNVHIIRNRVVNPGCGIKWIG